MMGKRIQQNIWQLSSGLVVLLFLTNCTEELIFDQEQQFQIDLQMIDEYLAENQLSAVEHASGLRYQILEQGTGSLPITGDDIGINAVITRLDGQPWVHQSGFALPAIEQTSSRRLGQGIGVVLNRPQAIYEILDVLRHGGSARLYVPSKLGYGYEGQRFHFIYNNEVDILDIGPNVNLIIELNLN